MMVTTAKAKKASPNTGSRCRSARNRGWLRAGSAWALLATLFVFVLVPGSSAAAGVCPASGLGGWYPGGWLYRKPLSIGAGNISSNLTSFPVLVSLTSDTDLADDAQADFDDILFTAADGTTKLSHEIEKYNETTGELVAWVKVPTVSSSVDTIVYMYYGNGSAGDQRDAVNVWDANYKAVWHLKEDPSGTSPQMKDSTSGLSHGASSGTMTSGDQVAGQIDGSLDFDGSDDYLELGSVGAGDPLRLNGSDVTISAWFNQHSAGDRYQRVVDKSDGGFGQNGYSLWIDPWGTSQYISIGVDGNEYRSSFGIYDYDTWTHVAAVITASDYYIYVNGVLDTSASFDSGSAQQPPATTTNMRIGTWNHTTGREWDGYLDEVRISDIERSADWLTAEYYNQNDPANFYALCGEEVPTTAVTTAVAEISPTDVTTSSTGNSFSYDIQATISGAATGVDTVAITVPGSFGAPTITAVQVDGSGVAYTNNTSGNAISVDLTTKVTATSKITVLFDSDAPGTQDLTGVDFTSTVDDSGTGDAAQSTTEGNGDGDGGDANTWTVTTTDAAGGGPGVCPALGLGGWYPGGWLYRKPLSVGADNIPTNLTSFPVLVNLTSDTDLADDAQADFDDILFTAADGTTKLSHEIEKYNETTGELVAWVKVPTVSSSVDTIVYMYYGNGSAGDQRDAANVWDTNFKGVWHLGETPANGGTHDDSTSNNNDGTFTDADGDSNTNATGKVDGADDFAGDADYVDVGTGASLNVSSAITVEAWAKIDTDTYGRIAAKHTAGDYGWALTRYSDTDAIEFALSTDGTNWNGGSTTADSWETNTWYHIVATYDGTTMRVYINGTEDTGGVFPTAPGPASINVASVSTQIGRDGLSGDSNVFDGILDEVRISSLARPADWITAEFSNQDNPANFYALCGEEVPTTAVTSAVAEISPTDVTTSSTGNSFSYDIQATISGAATGVDTVEITVPGSFGAPTVTDVLDDDVSVAYTNNTSGNAISVDITTKITASSKITVLFDADAPGTQDLTGVDFTSAVDDSGTGGAAQATTEGNGDGNAGDLNSWTVTTTDGAAGSLIGHWNFNEGSGQTAADSTASNNDGTLGLTASVESGDPTWVCSNTALDFDGSDDEVKLSSVSIGDSAAWSLTAWIKMSADSGDKRTIYGEGNTAQTEYLYLQVAQGGDNVTFYSQDLFASNSAELIGTTSVEDDAWHLISVVQRSKTDRELYVGTNSEHTNTDDPGTFSYNTASIGYLRADWVADPFKGIIDDVRIYDYALSTGEIATLNASPPAACGGATPAVTSAVAEIVANDVITSSTANSFSYDIQATISGSATGVEIVEITVPGSFGAPTITGVQVDGSGVAYTNNTSGNDISVDLTTKVTATSKITVLFNANAPTTEDLTGVTFLSTVDDSGTGDAAQATTEGNGDGDAGDNNSWTVTTTDGGFAVLLVVVDKTTPVAQDAAKKTLIESWGYTVTMIEDTESQGAFDTAVATSDVAYISEEITSTTLDTKLTNVCIGVVNDEEATADELGIASGNANYTTSTIDITNSSHYITSPFSSGALTITTSAQSLNIVSGTIAAGAQFLAEQPATANGTLVVIEVGGTLTSPPGGTAAGRRVYLPWGDGTFDINTLNTDGKLLMRRAIEWGTAGGSCGAAGPIAHWTFDEGTGLTAADSAGSHDGTLTNGPTWTCVAGGNALTFDGTDDYVDAGSAATLDIANSTVAAWFKADVAQVDEHLIVDKNQTGNVDGDFLLMIQDSDDSPSPNHVRLFLENGVSSVSIFADAPVTFGTWTHAAVTFGSGGMEMYIDGVKQADTNANTSGMDNTVPSLLIGRQGSDPNDMFDGAIDEVRIYDRVLSQAEITALAASAPTDCGTTTTIGNVAEPGNVTIAPGAAITDLDNFTLVASSGTDTVTAATVTLGPAGAFNNIGQADITDTSNVAQCTAITNPGSNTLSFTGCSIPVTTTVTTFKVRITPKTHANMPAVPGASYDVTGTVTAFTSTNTQAGTDSGSATITVDNLSPSNVTGAGATPGDTQATVNWTNPVSDFSNVLILRNTATIGDVPTEGSSPAVDTTIGTSVVRYIASGTSFIDTGLTNGTPYFYRIFAKDPNGNYAATGVEVSATPTIAGLIAHWTFDEGTGLTAADSVGSNDGTLTNGPTWACVTGGNALDFDGTDDYVDAGSGANLDNLRDMTVSVWLKPRAKIDILPRIFEKRAAAAEVKNLYLNTNDTLIFIHKTTGTNVRRDTTAALPLDVWSHVVLTWDGTLNASGILFYVDGSLAAMTAGTNGTAVLLDDDDGNLYIGNRDNGTRTFNGLIDDFRLYDRALTPAEITALAASAPTDCGGAAAVTSAVAEIVSNDVATSSTANAFSYDIQATISGGDTGVNRVAITVPGSFGAPTVTSVQVDGVGVAYTDNTSVNAISVDLTTKVTASGKLTVLFNSDAPTTQNLTGVDFTSTVDDSGTGDAAQATTEGNGDEDAGDLNSWTVTTTDGGGSGPGVCPAPDLGGWYPGEWLYRKPVSIGDGNVPSDVTNFPVLVSIPADTDLAADAQPDFDDILFTASDGTTKLSHEIEKYNATTGELVAWVKVPTVSSTADTILYMYYGNSSAASQQDPTGVWSNGYVGVWHLHDNFLDSSVPNNNGTNSGSTNTGGKIGDGSDFLPSNTAGVDVLDSTTLDLNSTVTVSVWFNPRVAPPATTYQRLAVKSTPTNASPWTMYGLLFDNVGHLRAEVASGGLQNSIEGTTPVQAGTWQYGTMTYDGTDLKLYWNGAEDQTPTTFSGSIDLNDEPLTMGKAGFDSQYFDGKLDEVRVSSVQRSTDWIATEFNNQDDPANFYSVCGEELGSTAVTTAVAEISPTDVATSSTGNSFSYDIQATISGGDTGVNRVAITVPGSFGAPTITGVQVDGSGVGYTNNTSGNDIIVDLDTKVTASSKLTILFDTDAPTTQDLTGVDFTSTVDDSGSGGPAQATTEGNGDGDAGDLNSWTVTTTDAPALSPLGRYCFNEAGSGTAPTTVLDDTANPVNLSITYDTGIAWFTHAGGHRGLNAATDPHVGTATALATGNKYSTNLDGASQATFSFVADWLPAADTQRIGGFFRNASRLAYIMVDSGGEIILAFYMQGGVQNRIRWPTSWEDGVRRAFHIVFDSDHPTDTSRIRLYMNGVDQGVGFELDGTWPTLGAALDFSHVDLDLSFLNEPDLGKPLHGTVYYYAVYDSELTDAEIATDAAALLADDDCAGTAGPIAHWTFDEGTGQTAADSSGNGYNATLGNDTGAASDDPAWACVTGGNALTFDGSADWVNATDIDAIDGISKLTITGWARPSSLSSFLSVMRKGGSDNSQFRMSSGGTSTAIRAKMGNGADTYGETAAGLLSADVWGHWAMVFDGTQTGNSARLKMYFNGTEETLTFSGTIPATTPSNAEVVQIGQHEYFPGDIDDVRIYNRPLSAAEISALAASAPTDCAANTTTIGNAADPGDVTIAPGAPITDLDNFTLVASSGTDTVTAVTVTLGPAGAFNNIGQADITDVSDFAQCTAITNPGSNTLSFTGCSIPVTTSITTFKIRITPKTHAGMPAVPGASYAVTGTVTAFTSTNTQAGTDTGSAEVTVDNLSPSNVTGASSTPDDTQATVNWTNPGSDFSNVLVLRNTATIGDVPTEGSSPAVDDSVGSSVVRYIVSGTSFIDTGLTNGTQYFYRIFAKDTNGNYAATGVEVSTTPTITTGLIGHWNFDEGTGQTAADSSGNGNNGTLGNLAGADGADPTWECVAGGYALSFDGTDDLVDAGSAAVLDDLGPMTIAAWIKPDAAGNSSARMVLSKSDLGSGRWFLEIDNTAPEDDAFEFNKEYNSTDIQRISSNSTAVYDVWQHVAVTWDGSDTGANIHIYKGGVETGYQSTVNGSTTQQTDAALPFTIGNRGDGSNPFYGLLDDVRVYDRVLTGGEITTLAASAPTDCAPAVSTAVAEISPNDVTTSSTANSFTYDIQTTISGGDTGVNRVAITVPGSFGAPTVTGVQVDGSPVAFTDNTVANAVSVDLTTKVTASSKITVLFDSDAPTTQDLTGVDFTSTVDDSGTGNAAQSTTEGNGDGDAGDLNSWTVTTTDGAVSTLSRWPLDETSGTNAADVGASHDGTYTNGVTLNQAGACANTDTGVYFGGEAAGQYVVVPHHDDYLIDSGTISLWANFDAFPNPGADPEHTVFSKDSSGFDTGGHVDMRVLTGGVVQVRLQSATANNVVNGSAITATAWHHLAFSWGAGGMKLYVDGAAPVTDPYTGGLGTTSGGIGNYEPITLGASTYNSDPDFGATPLKWWMKGYLDDVRIYDSPLSLAEIQTLAGCGTITAVTAAVAEISPNDVTTSSTGNSFSYDIQATIGGSDTGVNRVAITVPGSFGAPTVTGVQVDGSGVAYTDNTAGNAIIVDLTTKVTASSKITVLFDADAPISQDLTGVDFLSTVDDSGTGDAAQSTTEGNGDGDAGDANSWTVTTTDAAAAVTSVVAEISPNDVAVSSTANAFSYDIQATISGGATGVNRVTITVPGSFGAPTITGVQVDGSGVAFTDNTSGNGISIDLTSKVTASSKITVLFTADAPSTQDLVGVDFISTVDDSGTGYAAQATTEGNGDGDAGDLNSWTVTTSYVGIGSCPAPNVIFSDGFESGDLSAWDSSSTGTGDTIGASTVEVNTGTYSVRGETDSVADASAYVTKDFAGETTVVVQAYIYLDPAFAITGNVEVLYFNAASQVLATLIKPDLTLQLWNQVAGENYVGTTTITKGVWHFVEMEAVINGTTSEARLWLDGNLEVEQTGIDLGLNPITRLNAVRYWSQVGTEANILYFDDVVLCDQPMTASDPAVTSAVAEISPNNVTTSSTGNSFSYDIQATMLGGNTGVDRVTITVPVSFGAPTITDVEVDGTPVLFTDNTSGNGISIDLTTKVTASSRITVLFDADAPITQDLTGVNFVSTVDDSGTNEASQSTTEGNGDGDPVDANSWAVTTTNGLAVSAAVAEISPNDVVTSSTGNSFSYDIQATMSGNDTGVNRVAITVPGSFGAPTITAVQVDGSPVAYTNNTSGNTISIDLTTIVTVSSKITILFDADAPTSQDLTGVNFISTVDDSGTGDAAQATTEGDGDGNAGDNNSWTVTTTGGGGGGGSCLAVDGNASTGSTTTNSMTISHTTAGTDRLMIVGITIDNNQFEVVSTVTYNSIALTFVGQETNDNDARVEIWQLSEAGGLPTGTHDVDITFDADLVHPAVAGVITFTGVDQTTPLGSFFGNQNVSSNPGTVTVNSATGEMVLGVFSGETVNSVVTNAPAAERWNLSAGGTGETQYSAGSTDFGAANVTMVWSLGKADHWAAGGVSIKPAASCSGTAAVTSSGAEISPNNVTTSSTGNAFSYDIQATISGAATGVDRVAITVPGSFGAPTVTDVEVDGTPVAYTDNTAGNDISVDLTTKVTATSKLTVLFDADAPITQDLVGVDFVSTVDDSGTADAAQSTAEGNGDGDAGDSNSWTVITTDSAATAALSHWPLDETAGATAADVESAHDGTYTNGPTLNQVSACSNSGTAAYFGGEAAGEYVVIPHHDDFLLDNGTVSLWAKLDEFPNPGSDSEHGLFSKDSSGYDTGGHLTLRALSDGSIQTRMQSATTSYTIASAAAIPATTWAHIAFSWGTGGMKLYVDGGTPVTDPYTGGLGTTSGGSGNYEPISLGAAQVNSGDLSVTPLNRFMKGYLDDVRIYDSELSAAEILALATCPPAPAVTSAVAEITVNNVVTLSTTNLFTYDIGVIIGAGDTGVDRVAITVPGGFGTPTISNVLVDGLTAAYTNNTSGNDISVDLTTRVTASSQITVVFEADAPTTEDLAGADFVSTVDDTSTGDAAQATTEGNGDGDAADFNSWTVTTTGATTGGGTCDVDGTGFYIEAENYVPPLVPGTGPGSFLTQSSLAGYNGTSYLMSSGGSYTTPPENERADYTVNFTTTGTFYVWQRAYGNDTGTDSVFIGLDGTWVGALNDNGISDQWIWSDGVQTGVGTINVAATGQHTINLWVREPSHGVDGIYITQSSGAIPGGTSVGIPTGATIIDPNNCGSSNPAASAVAEISPNDVETSSYGNAFSYDIALTIGAGDTGVDRVGITVPGSFGPGSVTDVLVDDVSVSFTDNTFNNDISVDLASKVTSSGKITILFSADAPITQDLTGVDFLSTVDDSGNADTPTATTEGNGDADAGDNDSWTVTTTDPSVGGGGTDPCTIAVDGGVSTGIGTSVDNSITISHTTSGTDRLMLVGVSFVNQSNEEVLPNPNGVTYNGDPLTFVGAINNQSSGGDDARVEIWSLVAPDTGTHNVVVTFDQNLNIGAVAGVMTFNGVDQTTPLGAFASNEDQSISSSVTVSSAADELIFAVMGGETTGLPSADSPADERWSLSEGNTYAGGATQSGASPTVSFSHNNDYWAVGAVSIKPAQTCGGGSCVVFRDEFNSVSWSGSDGTGSWATDWLEIGETDGANTGDLAVTADGGSNRLQIKDNDGGAVGTQREVDLTGFTSATLTFDRRRQGLDSGEYVKLWVSANGGTSWTELDSFDGSGTDASYISESYDISAYIASNTRIRFLGNSTLGDSDIVFFDNVEISTTCGGSCDVDGSGFYIEAENYEALVDGTGTFTVESSLAGENGTGYLMSSGSDTSTPPGTDRVDYTVNFTATGTYTVWQRGYGVDSGSDSVFVGLDGTWTGAFNDNGQRNQWYWSKSTQAGGNTINVATTGQHTINLWIREDSHAVDGIYITLDSGAIPGGTSIGIPTGATVIDPNNCSSGGGSPVDHFAIDHDGYGINCQAENITITAHESGHSVFTDFNGTIKLSTTTSHGDWSVISGAGTLVNNGRGAGHYAFHPSDSGVVVLGLRDTFVETTNVNADHAIWSEDSGEDDDIDFARAGFNFLAGGVKNTIGTQIGGKDSDVAPGAQTLELQAVKTSNDTGACEAALVGATNVELAFECENPTSCSTRQLIINGTDLPQNADGTNLTYNAASIDFGNDTDSTATFTMNYPEVGEVRLHARYRMSPSAEWMLGGSNSFVVRPFAFSVSATGNPVAVSPAGLVFTSAGTDFSANVSAVLWEAADDTDNDGIADDHDDINPGNNANLMDNAIAFNYGQETSAEQVSLTALLDQPAGGNNPGLSGGTSISIFNSGIGTTNTIRYDEVGIIEISAAVGDGNYLGIGVSETGDVHGNSGYVGRFNPAQYAVTSSSITPACSATFTYARQPFNGTMTIEAQAGAAAGNVRTENYRAGFVSLDPATELVFINDQTTAAYDAKTVTYNQNFDSGTTGEAVLALQFRWDMPEQVPTSSTVQNTEVTDEVTTLAAAPVGIGSSPTRFGRAAFGSAVGSELINLGVPFHTEYYVDASTGYVTNVSDFCSTGGTLSFSNFAGNLGAGETCVEDSGSPGISGAGCLAPGPVTQRYDDPLIAGEFNLFLDAPGAGNDGSGTVDANVPDWLEFDWDTGVPGIEDPTGRFTFGIYGGDKNQVYRRELY